MPDLPPPSPSALTLVLAGAPVQVFGDEAAPDFEGAFQRFADSGFDLFFPFFGLSEEIDPQGNPFNPISPLFHHFFQPGSPHAAPGYDCTVHNPYAAAAGRIGILFPAFLFDPTPNRPLDDGAFLAAFDAWYAGCLGDLGPDAAEVVPAFDTYDEPVTNYVVSRFERQPALDLGNIAAMRRLLASRMPGAKLHLIEAPFPLAMEWNDDFGLEPTVADGLVQEFWDLHDQVVPHADVFGYDLYPVPKTSDLGLVGQWVRHARTRKLNGAISATLQGFGYADQTGNPSAGRRPTAAETRAMAYVALVEGARVLIWWGQSMMDLSQSPPDLWEAILATGAELDALSGILEAPEAQVEALGVPLMARAAGDLVHLVAVNPTDAVREAEVVWDEPVCAVWDRRASPGEELKWAGRATRSTLRLDPYEVAVWTVRRCGE